MRSEKFCANPGFPRVKRQLLPIHPGLAGAKVWRENEGAKGLFAKVLKKWGRWGCFQNKICGGRRVFRKQKMKYFCRMNNAAKVKINSQNLGVDEILAGVAQLDTPELEDFAQQVSYIVAHRKAPSLSKEEEVLLGIINRGFSEEFWRRYKSLFAKKENKSLTESEYNELLRMVEQVEEYNVERLKSLIDLAKIREVSLDSIMHDLGIGYGKGI